jgi:hypothetical protein
MLGNNYVGSVAFIRQHQCLAQSICRLRQDCGVWSDDEQTPRASRHRPSQQISGDSGRLTDANGTFAGHQCLVRFAVTARVVK